MILQWTYSTPRVGIVLLFVLSVAMACALWIMGLWQLLLISQAQTTVEANDNEYYRKVKPMIICMITTPVLMLFSLFSRSQRTEALLFKIHTTLA